MRDCAAVGEAYGDLSGNICLFLAFTEWPSFPFQVLRVQWGLCRQRQAVPWDPCYPLYLPPDLSQGGSSQPREPRGPHGELTVRFLCGAEHDGKGVVQNPTELLFSCSFSYGFTKEVMQKYKVCLCFYLLYHVRRAFRRLDASSLFWPVLLGAWEENLEDVSECLLLATPGHPDWPESPHYSRGHLWHHWPEHAWENPKGQSRFYFPVFARDNSVADLWWGAHFYMSA